MRVCADTLLLLLAAALCTTLTARRASDEDKKKLIDSVDCFIFDCDGELTRRQHQQHAECVCSVAASLSMCTGQVVVAEPQQQLLYSCACLPVQQVSSGAETL